MFSWALFRSTKSSVRLHTLLDLRGNIPALIHVSEAKWHDVNVLDLLVPNRRVLCHGPGIRGLQAPVPAHSLGAFFVVRAKSNIQFRRRYSAAADKSAGVRCD